MGPLRLGHGRLAASNVFSAWQNTCGKTFTANLHKGHKIQSQPPTGQQLHNLIVTSSKIHSAEDIQKVIQCLWKKEDLGQQVFSILGFQTSNKSFLLGCWEQRQACSVDPLPRGIFLWNISCFNRSRMTHTKTEGPRTLLFAMQCFPCAFLSLAHLAQPRTVPGYKIRFLFFLLSLENAFNLFNLIRNSYCHGEL